MSCKIYCIEDCNQLKYIGSTLQTLKRRLINHRADKKRVHRCSSEKLDLDNCKIYQLESCDVSDRCEKEKYWINHIDCVNERKMNFNKKKYDKEYHIENKERKKEYCDKHKERKKEYDKNKRIYEKSWGGEIKYGNNSLLKIDVNLFFN
tara:strand:- start:68 stop:514 length:447 start_codon:yes stop_codon:yes gene_type:complete